MRHRNELGLEVGILLELHVVVRGYCSGVVVRGVDAAGAMDAVDRRTG